MNATALRIERLSKSFGSVRVLDNVSIEVGAREVVGVLGENGAGKSTLLKVLAGLCRPDSGQIVVRGRMTQLNSPREAADAGIGMVFQEQSLLPNLSVAENIMLGHEGSAVRAGFYDWRKLRALAAAQLAKLDSCIALTAQTDTLSFAERQVVELAKVLVIEERTQLEPVILLDEPTSILESGQVETVLRLIERLRQRASVVFVSHCLNEVLRVCDRVYVLAEGRCVGQRHRANCTAVDLQALMLGRPGHIESGLKAVQERSASDTAAILSVRNLSRAGSYRAVSFELQAGEVLGIAGRAGSGRESLCRSLFGAEVPDSGEIALDDRPVTFSEPSDAVRLGIGYVPAERVLEGFVAGLSVRENMTLAHPDEISRGPFMNLRREKALVRTWIDRLRIKPCTPHTMAQLLSGGNQQKLVLAKWLMASTLRVLILDHPLRGLDVGAKGDMAAAIRELARSGIGVVLVAEMVDGLITMSDRVIVMKNGEVSGRFDESVARPAGLRVFERMF